MNLLDRYIFKSVLFTCAAAIGLFAFLMVTVNIVRDLLAPGLAGHMSVDQFVQLSALLVPFVVSYALPMGILTGVLLALGRLSADGEITAMRASGIGLGRIARPVFILGAIGALAGLRINFESMPWARVQYDKELTAAARADPLNFIVPRTFIRDFPGYVAYVGEKEGDRLKDVWLWELDAQKRVTNFVRAADGRLDYDEPDNEFILTLSQAQVETRNGANPEDFSDDDMVATFEKMEPTRLPLDKLFGRTGPRQKIDWMTYGELRRERAKLVAQVPPPGGTADRARALLDVAITIQKKFNIALAALSFAFIGVPLGIKVSRRETSANLGLAVILGLGWYFVTVMVGWLDRHPELRPDLLLWVPNLLFLGIGIWLFRRMDRA